MWSTMPLLPWLLYEHLQVSGGRAAWYDDVTSLLGPSVHSLWGRLPTSPMFRSSVSSIFALFALFTYQIAIPFLLLVTVRIVLLPPDLTSRQCVVQCLRALGNVWTVTLSTQYELIQFIYFQNTKFENQNSIQYFVSKNISVFDLKEIWNNRTNLLTNNYLLTALGERVKN